jgi:hypothetical protein
MTNIGKRCPSISLPLLSGRLQIKYALGVHKYETRTASSKWSVIQDTAKRVLQDCLENAKEARTVLSDPNKFSSPPPATGLSSTIAPFVGAALDFSSPAIGDWTTSWKYPLKKHIGDPTVDKVVAFGNGPLAVGSKAYLPIEALYSSLVFAECTVCEASHMNPDVYCIKVTRPSVCLESTQLLGLFHDAAQHGDISVHSYKTSAWGEYAGSEYDVFVGTLHGGSSAHLFYLKKVTPAVPSRLKNKHTDAPSGVPSGAAVDGHDEVDVDMLDSEGHEEHDSVAGEGFGDTGAMTFVEMLERELEAWGVGDPSELITNPESEADFEASRKVKVAKVKPPSVLPTDKATVDVKEGTENQKRKRKVGSKVAKPIAQQTGDLGFGEPLLGDLRMLGKNTVHDKGKMRWEGGGFEVGVGISDIEGASGVGGVCCGIGLGCEAGGGGGGFRFGVSQTPSGPSPTTITITHSTPHTHTSRTLDVGDVGVPDSEEEEELFASVVGPLETEVAAARIDAFGATAIEVDSATWVSGAAESWSKQFAHGNVCLEFRSNSMLGKRLGDYGEVALLYDAAAAEVVYVAFTDPAKRVGRKIRLHGGNKLMYSVMVNQPADFSAAEVILPGIGLRQERKRVLFLPLIPNDVLRLAEMFGVARASSSSDFL